MVKRDTTKTGKASGSGGRHIRHPAHQRGCRPTGRPLFLGNILVLGNRHRLHLAAVHPDGPGAGAALSWLREGEVVLDADHVCFLQHGLSPLLCPMVVLALVLLVLDNIVAVFVMGSELNPLTPHY